MIKNIVFDVGNVLVNWDARGYLRSIGYDEQVIEAIGDAMFTKGYWNQEDLSIMPSSQVEDLLVSAAPQYEDKIRYFYHHAENAVKQYDYAKPWIRDLQQRGYKVYALSNYGERMFKIARDNELNFIDLLDGSLFSYEIKICKPDKEIYEIFLKRFNLKAEECLFFDDSMANVEAARICGFESELFASYSKAVEYIEKLKQD